MSYLKYDSTVKVLNGYYCFHTITQFRGVDWKQVETNQNTGEYVLNQSIEVVTKDKNVEVTFIKYLGFLPLHKIIFSNGLELSVYKNQKLIVIDPLSDDVLYYTVTELQNLLNTSEILIKTKDSFLSITSIISDFEVDHVYSLVFNTDDINSEYYIQYDIAVV